MIFECLTSKFAPSRDLSCLLSAFACSFWSFLLALERSAHLFWNIQCRNYLCDVDDGVKKAFFHFAKLLPLSFGRLLRRNFCSNESQVDSEFSIFIDVRMCLADVANNRSNTFSHSSRLQCLIYDFHPSVMPPSSSSSARALVSRVCIFPTMNELSFFL